MTSRTQGLVAVTVAALLLRISLNGEFLRFVQPWMRWPLVATGLVLLLMGLRLALGWVVVRGRVPAMTWLLLVPWLVVFNVAPPPLGAYVAERRVSEPSGIAPDRTSVAQPVDGGPRSVAVEELTWGAAQPGDPLELRGSTVETEGFVSTDQAGDWYATVLVMYCCAADVQAERVKIVGHAAPARNQWVLVTGEWIEGTGVGPGNPAALRASAVEPIPSPEDPYS